MADPAGGSAALAHWLLTGPAQRRTGPHAGAVAGTVAADGTARYVYPEITGYFLHWLASQAARRGSERELTLRAQAAQGWLRRWLACAPVPPTRIYADPATADWRNGALFFFDLAMVLRGLAAAVRWRVVEPDPVVIGGVCTQMRALIGRDGMFEACAPHAGLAAVPVRWSTRRGGFLAKAAAGVITAAEDLPGIPADIAAAAEATYADALRAAVDSPHAESHPLLYTFEGILNLPAHPRFAGVAPQIARQFDALLVRTAALGRVPETLGSGDSGVARNDVLAQALRVGHFLDLHRRDAGCDHVVLGGLRSMLVGRIERDGAVAFAAGANEGERNVWATMFAEQALALPARGADSAPEGRLLL